MNLHNCSLQFDALGLVQKDNRGKEGKRYRDIERKGEHGDMEGIKIYGEMTVRKNERASKPIHVYILYMYVYVCMYVCMYVRVNECWHNFASLLDLPVFYITGLFGHTNLHNWTTRVHYSLLLSYINTSDST